MEAASQRAAPPASIAAPSVEMPHVEPEACEEEPLDDDAFVQEGADNVS